MKIGLLSGSVLKEETDLRFSVFHCIVGDIKAKMAFTSSHGLPSSSLFLFLPLLLLFAFFSLGWNPSNGSYLTYVAAARSVLYRDEKREKPPPMLNQRNYQPALWTAAWTLKGAQKHPLFGMKQAASRVSGYNKLLSILNLRFIYFSSTSTSSSSAALKPPINYIGNSLQQQVTISLILPWIRGLVIICFLVSFSLGSYRFLYFHIFWLYNSPNLSSSYACLSLAHECGVTLLGMGPLLSWLPTSGTDWRAKLLAIFTASTSLARCALETTAFGTLQLYVAARPSTLPFSSVLTTRHITQGTLW